VKIAVFSDVHGNLPALEAALAAIQAEGCEEIVHCGDAFVGGPHPEACLDLLLRTPNLHALMGNHDAWYADGLRDPLPALMDEDELAHQRWIHARLDPGLRAVVAGWPYVMQAEYEGVRVACMHYEPGPPGAPPGQEFARVVRAPCPKDLDRLFGHYGAEVVLFGHTHHATDVVGQARYVDLGSLGCHKVALARYVVIECREGRYTLEHKAVPYDDRPLFMDFEARQVPARAFLYKAFHGGRFEA
jgi:predicted phosphodiesterase